MKEKFSSLVKRINERLGSKDVFAANEVQSNRVVSGLMFNCSIILLVCWLLNQIGFFPLDKNYFSGVFIQGMLSLLVPCFVSDYLKHEKSWLKYMLLTWLTFAFANIDAMLTIKTVPLMFIPVIVSSRYFVKKLTVVISVISAVSFAVSAWVGALRGLLDMNIVSLPVGTTLTVIGRFVGEGVRSLGLDGAMLIRNTMLYSFLPKLLIFLPVAIFCCSIASRGREMIEEQDAITRESSRIESELSLAKNIQLSMLPKTFPPYPNRKEFDIYALMEPAKEVAGDFYDLFMLDDTHLAFLMADVSGKSVPAALFMAVSKSMIKNLTQTGVSPALIFERANTHLCDGNEQGFFVTAWLGILDTDTGHLVYCNAGHCPPAVYHDGKFEYLKCKPGFILGGLDGYKYEEAEIWLEKNDAIFLYTDGVSEADDENHDLYGEERLLKVLNEDPACSMQKLCERVKDAVEYHSRNIEQFDDITMLGLRYLGIDDKKVRTTVKAEIDNLSIVTSRIDDQLIKADCPKKNRMQIDVIIDEIFSNICKHGYKGEKGDVTVESSLSDDNKTFTLVFKDHGVPFDPVSYINPELKKPAILRKIGGLGLFMVRKSSDEMKYENRDNQNILTIVKNLDGD